MLVALTIAVFLVGVVGLFFLLNRNAAKTAKQSRPPLPSSRGLPSYVYSPNTKKKTRNDDGDDIITDFTSPFTLFDNDSGSSSCDSGGCDCD